MTSLCQRLPSTTLVAGKSGSTQSGSRAFFSHPVPRFVVMWNPTQKVRRPSGSVGDPSSSYWGENAIRPAISPPAPLSTELQLGEDAAKLVDLKVHPWSGEREARSSDDLDHLGAGPGGFSYPGDIFGRRLLKRGPESKFFLKGQPIPFERLDPGPQATVTFLPAEGRGLPEIVKLEAW